MGSVFSTEHDKDLTILKNIKKYQKEIQQQQITLKPLLVINYEETPETTIVYDFELSNECNNKNITNDSTIQELIRQLTNTKITTKDEYIYIVKTINDVISNYVSYNGYYYLIEENDYRLVYESQVFDILPYQLLDINNINNYIKLGTENNDNIVKRYNIKIKDITLLDSIDNITISLIANDYEIDYTNLLKLYDKYEYFKVIVSMK